jgi:hypothetical protein
MCQLALPYDIAINSAFCLSRTQLTVLGYGKVSECPLQHLMHLLGSEGDAGSLKQVSSWVLY